MEVVLTDELLNKIADQYQGETNEIKEIVDFDTYLDTKIFNINCKLNRNVEFKYI